MHPTEPEPLPYQVFNSISNRRLIAFISIAAGVALVLVAVAGFFFALQSKNSNFIAFHGLTTVPMIIAVGLFASAYPALCSATRVIVGEHDLTVFRGASELGRWPWTQIALASTAQSAGHKQILKLYGDTGKRLVTLTEDLEAFPAMVDQIKRRMAQNPSPQRTSVAHRTGRRRGIFLILGGLAFLALAAANTWLAVTERQAAHLLKTQGQPAQAIIVANSPPPTAIPAESNTASTRRAPPSKMSNSTPPSGNSSSNTSAFPPSPSQAAPISAASPSAKSTTA